MAKFIKVTDEEIEKLRKDFEDTLKNLKMSDGKISITKTFGTIDRKATLYFSEIAYLKMKMLVNESSKEIGWHGIAKRGDDPDKDEYYITDIMVYPQEVTAATVTTDQEKYSEWLMTQEDFDNIRMQGHSHVNMSTSPSSVDDVLYEGILDQLEDDMFYIFMIWNKRDERTIKIYDMAKNVLFETADVNVMVIHDLGIIDFLDDAKNKVTEKQYATSYSTSTATTPTPVGSSVGVKAPETTYYSGKKKKKKSSNRYTSYGYDDDDDDDDLQKYYQNWKNCYNY